MVKHYGKILISTAVLLAAMMAIYVGSMAVTAKADTVETGWKHIPFYTAASNPKTAWYYVYTGQMYDKAADALAAAPTWTDCVTAITINDKTGLFEDAPDTVMPTGEYIWRLYDAASPAYTDVPEKSKLVFWSKERQMIIKISDL